MCHCAPSLLTCVLHRCECAAWQNEIADCDFGLRRANTAKTGQYNHADAEEWTRGKQVNDMVHRGKASVRDFKVALKKEKCKFKYHDGKRWQYRIKPGHFSVPLFLAVGTGLRSSSTEMPTIYVLDAWGQRHMGAEAHKGAERKFTMFEAIRDFVMELEGGEPPSEISISCLIHAISNDASPSDVAAGAKEGYPPVGVIKGCPFIVGRLDGTIIAGREDLLEGFLFKMGLR